MLLVMPDIPDSDSSTADLLGPGATTVELLLKLRGIDCPTDAVSMMPVSQDVHIQEQPPLCNVQLWQAVPKTCLPQLAGIWRLARHAWVLTHIDARSLSCTISCAAQI